MNRTNRAVIVYGNDAILHIHMKRYDKQTDTFIDFDMTNTTDVTVELTCSKHATHIPLEFTINSGNNSILDCPIDYRLLHANTSYGVIVEGYDENEEHFRFEMLPSELMLVVNNTSGLKITDDVSEESIESITVTGAVGWGIAATIHADWEETDPEADSYIENKPDIDGMIDSALENYYDKTETDTLLSGKADDSDLASKQDTLVSGTNIKTINNQSILGSGNIDIQGGGATYTAGDNIDITNDTISLDDDITINTVNSANYNVNRRIDYVKWWDGEHRYLAEQAMAGNQYRMGRRWVNRRGYTLYINTQDGLVSIGSEWVWTDGNALPSYVQPKDDVFATLVTRINGEPVYGVFNPDTGNPDFFIYDENYNITEVYAEYNFKLQPDWNDNDQDSPNYINNKPDIPNYTGGNSIVIDQTTNEVSLQEVVNAKYISVKKIYNGGEIYQIDYQRWTDTPCRYLAPGALSNTQYRIGNQWYGWGIYYNLIIETESHGTSSFNSTWVTAVSLPAWLGGGDPSGWFYTGDNFTVNGEPVYGVYHPDTDSPDFYIYDADNYDITHMYVVYTYPSMLLHANWNENDYNSPSFIEGKPNLSNYATTSDLANKQDTLVSGTNIKTINNTSLLGSGDITISGGAVQSNWNETDSSSYAYILNKPDMSDYVLSSSLATVATSGNYNDLTNTPTIPAAPVQSNWNESDSSSLAYILNKPTIPAAQVQSNWNESDSSSLAYIQNKPTIPAAQVQSNWNESDSSSLAYIQNKPTINTPGFNQLVNGNNTGLVNSLSTAYNTNIGNGAVIEGEGYRTIKIEATGKLSHAEGSCTHARGQYSHAEGDSTSAQGQSSHTEGSNTITNNLTEHASGRYNISVNNSATWGNSGNTLFSIGNGNGVLTKHNAVEIKQNGDIYISDTNNTTYSNFYEKPMLKLQDAMVTSTTNGLKIEVVSALPASPDSNTIYVVI